MNTQPLEMEGLTSQLSTISLDYEISGICEKGYRSGRELFRSTSSRRYAMKYIGEFSRSDSDMFSISTVREASENSYDFFFLLFFR